MIKRHGILECAVIQKKTKQGLLPQDADEQNTRQLYGLTVIG